MPRTRGHSGSSHSSGLAVGLGLGALQEMVKKSLPGGYLQSGELATLPGVGPWPGCVTGTRGFTSQSLFPPVDSGGDANIPTSQGL